MMRTPLPVSALALAALSLSTLTLACSGQVFTEGNPNPPGDDAGTDSAPTLDSGPLLDGPVPDSPIEHGPCPSSAPPPGTQCTLPDLECEYGSSIYPGCDTIAQCTSGAWQQQELTFCPPSNSADCPPSMAAANGSSCQPGPYGSLSCFYPNGGCYCGSLGGPIPIEPDGGYPPQTWQCDDPGPQCPLPRPRLGTTCGDEGLNCQYLECAFAQSCTGGIWVPEPEGCAVAGSGSSGP